MTLSGTLSTPQGMSGMLSLSAGTDPTLSREGVAADAKAVGELKADIIEDTVSGPIANITDAKAGAVNSLEVAITPKQAGSGNPSPTNVRAISGWTEANVTRAGKNLADVTIENMIADAGSSGGPKIANNANGRSFSVPVKAGQTYTVSRVAIESNRFRIAATVDKPAHMVPCSIFTYNDNAFSTTVTIPAGYNWIFVYLSSNGGTVTTGNYQVEVGSTATAYEPYAGTTKTIDWQSQAGTVYGGTLNVTTGLLTVTDANIASYAGETLPSTWISSKDVYAAGTTPTTGAQVVYKLATPVTYQLTPTEVTTLLGENNIWADTGDVEVEYKCDTKLYIQKLTMPTEDDMTANQNIASGKFFMIGNSLYYSTASIANGAKIIVGTNCNRVSLADALNNINS